MIRFFALWSCVFVAPNIATAAEQRVGLETARLIPNVLIVRVPIVAAEGDSPGQKPNVDVDVFPLRVEPAKLEDGTIDVAKLRNDVLTMMQTTDPVRVEVDDSGLANFPADLQKGFHQAEAQTSDEATEPAIAWRGYGPVRGYSAGIVAYNRSVYRGYNPGSTYPYYGYYYQPGENVEGVTFHYHYGVSRSTPSYRYYGYYRHF